MGSLVPYFGEFVVGDTLSTLVVTIKDRASATGAPLDLTGKTATLIGRAKTGGEVLSIAGTLSGTPTDGKVTITNPTNGVSLGAKRADKIEAQIKLTAGTDKMYTTRFSYSAVVAADSTV